MPLHKRIRRHATKNIIVVKEIIIVVDENEICKLYEKFLCVHLWSVIEGMVIIAVCFDQVVSFELTKPSYECSRSNLLFPPVP